MISQSKKKGNPQIKKPESTSKKSESKSKKQEPQTKITEDNRKSSKKAITPPKPREANSGTKSSNPRFGVHKSFDKHLINVENFKFFEKSARGAFGTVYFIIDTDTGKKYAVKDSGSSPDSEDIKFVLREINILIHVQHPTIVPFEGISYKNLEGFPGLLIFMKYIENGSLRHLIQLHEKSLCPLDYDNTKRQIILVGIARAMMLLHQNHIIHRDLKPENVLLDYDYKPHVTDFGLSKFFDPSKSKRNSMICGTPQYMAPEVFVGTRFNSKADVYSFGILMYEVVTGKNAYGKAAASKDLRQKVIDGLRPELDSSIKKGIRRMIEQCWSPNPTERPTFAEIYNKLSLSNSDFYVNSDNFICESVIKDDDDDDDEIDNRKYCLDDVNIDELFMYVEEIEGEVTNSKDQADNQALKEEIKQLKAHNKEMEKKFNALNSDNQQLKKEISQLKEIISKIQSEPKNTKSTVKKPSKTKDEDKNEDSDDDDDDNDENDVDDDEDYDDDDDDDDDDDNTNKKKSTISKPKQPSQEDLENQCRELSEKVKEGEITKVELPKNLVKIPRNLFKNRTLLRSIKIPSTVTTIENSAFEGCSSLIEIQLPSSLQSIGSSAFKGCSSITSIKIPRNVKSIENSTFEGCSALSKIDIPSSLVSVGNSSFRGCKLLKSIELPLSVKSIGNSAFKECSSLTSIEIPSHVKTIEDSTFWGCGSLESVDIPSSVASIGNKAFFGCASISNIEIPSSVKSIGNSAFLGCASLESIEIPSSVESIGDSCFMGCASLSKADVPSSVSMGNSVFMGCVSLPGNEESSSNVITSHVRVIRSSTTSHTTSSKF